MGTRCRIVLYAESEDRAAEAAGAAFDRISVLESVLSDYRADSESSRLARLPAGAWHEVSADLFGALERSRAVFEASDGAFDPTVGPFTVLWRASRRAGRLPESDALDDARAVVGFGGVELMEPDRVRLRKSGMGLDFGGIGKGLAADAAIAALRAAGLPMALVDFGGDVVAGDPPPDEPDGWRVEIRDGIGAIRTFRLKNAAVATSGDLEQFVDIDGVRYSHIVDPRTGLGLTRRRAATVVADHGWLADALASAACVLGPTGSERLGARFPGVVIECVEGD